MVRHSVKVDSVHTTPKVDSKGQGERPRQGENKVSQDIGERLQLGRMESQKLCTMDIAGSAIAKDTVGISVQRWVWDTNTTVSIAEFGDTPSGYAQSCIPKEVEKGG